uniref:ATP synthase F0 subunit b n=1 Tax=Jakoba bahamiensis TaxID=221721 RepID=Q85II0_9EUKA|nr:ATP synthase F0 subunit b [Jakoba bahamiensis]AAO45014.1 ATP synthase F0 subunit b [Jakoba bahamiensis]AGH24115.1 ATP synthase F0 subunit b [Jakoba bahamiensis]
MLVPFIQNKNVISLLVFSIIAGLAAEGILTVNAQFLVALCFAFFIIFAYLNVKDVVVSELNDRASQIQKEFEDAFRLKEEVLKTIVSYYRKQLHLTEEITSIYQFSKEQIHLIISSRRKALESKLMQEIGTKLETVLMKEKALYSSMQTEAVNYIVAQILNASQEDLLRLDKECVREAIEIIKGVSSK